MTDNEKGMMERAADKGVLQNIGHPGGAVAPMVPRNLDEAFRMAQAVAAADMAPKSYNRKAEAILVGILHGMEVGFTPMAALQSIAVINGMPTIWGDGALALVQKSGLCESIEEKMQGEGDKMMAVCTVKRVDRTPSTRTFSMEDAHKAQLLGKDPWKKYPQRMLQMRARSWALRDNFADVLRGLQIREEVEDMPTIGSHSTVGQPRPQRSDFESQGSQSSEVESQEAANGETQEELFEIYSPVDGELIADKMSVEEFVAGVVSTLDSLEPDNDDTLFTGLFEYNEYHWNRVPQDMHGPVMEAKDRYDKRKRQWLKETETERAQAKAQTEQEQAGKNASDEVNQGASDAGGHQPPVVEGEEKADSPDQQQDQSRQADSVASPEASDSPMQQQESNGPSAPGGEATDSAGQQQDQASEDSSSARVVSDDAGSPPVVEDEVSADSPGQPETPDAAEAATSAGTPSQAGGEGGDSASQYFLEMPKKEDGSNDELAYYHAYSKNLDLCETVDQFNAFVQANEKTLAGCGNLIRTNVAKRVNESIKKLQKNS